MLPNAVVRRLCRLLACAAPLIGSAAPVLAQPPKAPPVSGPKVDQGIPASAAADPVIAIVEGHSIYLSQLGRAAQALPENLRGLPFDTLYPVLLDRIVDHEALVTMARRGGLENRAEVQQEIQAATDRILEGAYLQPGGRSEGHRGGDPGPLQPPVCQPAGRRGSARPPHPGRDRRRSAQGIWTICERRGFRDGRADRQQGPGRRQWRRSRVLPPRAGLAGLRRRGVFLQPGQIAPIR